MRQKKEITSLYKVFLATALLITACGKPYQVYDAQAIAIEKEAYLNLKTEALEESAQSTETDEESASINSTESSEDELITTFKTQISTLIERLEKIDTSLLPSDANNRLQENIASLKDLLSKANDQGAEGQEFRTQFVTLRRADLAHQALGISEEEKQLFHDQACLTMKTILEKNDFSNDRLKSAVQSDFNKQCQ